MVYTHVAAALIAASLAGTAAWQTQAWRYDTQIAKTRAAQAQALVKAERDARDREQTLQRKKDEADHAAKKRDIQNRAAADAARLHADGLHDALAAARLQLPGAACGAVREHAATVGALLDQCSRSYQGLAEKADGHASDARALTEAWPVNVKPDEKAEAP